MNPKSAKAYLPTPTVSPTTKLGVLIAPSTPGALLVEYDGSGPLTARSTIAMDQSAIARAIATRQPALLLFENGDARLQIVVGLVQPSPGAALFGALLAAEAPDASADKRPIEARIDGEQVVLEGRESVTLKCGDATITLRRDGKVILKGAYIETRAKGVNRIRGGSVKIN
jgi:Domain of unknown function (DUF6484)